MTEMTTPNGDVARLVASTPLDFADMSYPSEVIDMTLSGIIQPQLGMHNMTLDDVNVPKKATNSAFYMHRRVTRFFGVRNVSKHLAVRKDIELRRIELRRKRFIHPQPIPFSPISSKSNT